VQLHRILRDEAARLTDADLGAQNVTRSLKRLRLAAKAAPKSPVPSRTSEVGSGTAATEVKTHELLGPKSAGVMQDVPAHHEPALVLVNSKPLPTIVTSAASVTPVAGSEPENADNVSAGISKLSRFELFPCPVETGS
jgi:hypothetical protein